MTRRKAIYAMLCGIVGPTAASQLNTQGLTVNTYTLPLDDISFAFTYKGETVKLSGKEIWKELNRCQDGQACFSEGKP